MSIGFVVAVLALLALPAVMTAGPTVEGMIYMMEKFQYFQNVLDAEGKYRVERLVV